MNAYIDTITVTDADGNESILYPRTKKEAVFGLQEALENLANSDITETTDTTMPNSYDGRFLFKKIKGVCQQGANPSPTSPQEIKYFKGKNLLDCRGLTAQTVKGVTFTPIKDEQGNLLYIEANGTASANAFYYLKTDLNLPNGSYCLNGYPSASNIVGVEYYVADANAKTYGTNNASDTVFTVTDNGTFQVFIIIKSGYTATNLRFYPMIRKASIADNTYVPYGLLRVTTHGKNLLNINKEPYLANNMVNGHYGFYPTETCDVYRINNPKSGNIYFKVGITETNISVGFYRNDGTLLYAEKYANRNNFAINNNYSADYMLVTVEKGDNAFMVSYENAPYEPYVESSVTLSQPIDLYKIGDVQDVIEGGKVKNEYALCVLDGTKNISRSPQEKDSTTYRFYISDANVQSKIKKPASNKVADILSDALIPKSSDNVYWSSEGISVDSNGNFQVYHEKFKNYTVEQMREFLTNTPISVVYRLATPTTETLPIADQVALNSLATYDGITYLEFDAEIQPTFDGEYGTSKVGGYTLEGMLAGLNGELLAKSNLERINALETSVVNNI